MIKTWIQSFQIKNAYRVNTFIYSLKQLPLIGKVFKNALYGNTALKILGTFYSIIVELISTFLGKFLYLLFLIYLILPMYPSPDGSYFVHLLLFLTGAGALLNTYLFNPTKDKYYAMFTLKMDAKKYTLSDYYDRMLKVVIGFMPFTCLFGILSQVPVWICILLPFYVAAFKILVNVYFLEKYKRTGIVTDENHPVKGVWLWILFFLILAYGLPYIQIVLPLSFSVLFLLLVVIGGIWGIFYLQKYSKYREIYKIILTNDNMNLAAYQTKNMEKKTVQKGIDVNTKIVSHKTGYAYFNELFVKRHSRILSKSAIKITWVMLGIFFFLTVFTLSFPVWKERINSILLVMLPYFVFIMYCINRGQEVCKAMFMNCDHSMLTYGFYRKPKVLLNLFKERLKSVILINLLPAFTLALGLVFLLYITGGTTQFLDYPILFFSILAMSIFFSVHHLVLYYLLQPYNQESETKSATYGIANGATYLFCYYMLKIRIPIFTFGCCTILFSILYCLISLFLVYRYAPKTFHLKN